MNTKETVAERIIQLCKERSYAWQTAIGLQAVDGLETFDYLK